MSDPDELPGLAHFCEHMLFLGTKKYPEENEYSKVCITGIQCASMYICRRSRLYFTANGNLQQMGCFHLCDKITDSMCS